MMPLLPHPHENDASPLQWQTTTTVMTTTTTTTTTMIVVMMMIMMVMMMMIKALRVAACEATLQRQAL
jgi:hypothetical protein